MVMELTESLKELSRLDVAEFFKSNFDSPKPSILYCRVPGKWGLQQSHYPPVQTGQINPVARLTLEPHSGVRLDPRRCYPMIFLFMLWESMTALGS